MIHLGAMRTWGLGGLATTVFVFTIITLKMVSSSGMRKDEHPREPSGVAAPGAETLAARSPSPPDVKPLRAAGRSGPGGDDRSAPGTEPGRRGGEPGLAPGAANLRANEQRPELRSTDYAGGVDSTTLSAPYATIGSDSPVLVPHVPDSRREGSTLATSALPATGMVVQRAGTTTAAADGASPDGSDTQEEKTVDEDDTLEPETPAGGDPGSDHTPPVLKLLSFDPPVVEGGKVTKLTVRASDDLSGVKAVRGEIRSPNRSALLPFGTGEIGSGDVLTFPITIPNHAESGVWYIAWISLTDGAANSTLIQAGGAAAAPPGGSLTVSSSESDSTPPEVLQVWFDKATVNGGEKNAISVEARDDSSGVTSVIGACQSRFATALIWFTCTLNTESGIWEGDVLIPKNADCGEWEVQQLVAKDKAGNTTLLSGNSPLLPRAGFSVSSRADCDSIPPTLDAFDLSQTIVSSETSNEILATATIYDEGSGAVTMSGWFEGPVSTGGQVPKSYFQCRPDPNDPAAPWTCRIMVPQLAAVGTWRVGVIRLEDKAHNFREYTEADPVISGRVFEVQ